MEIPYEDRADFAFVLEQADGGNADAQYIAAGQYIEGKVTEQDPVKAYHYLLLSAKQNNLSALVELGEWYMTGNLGIQKDEAKGVRCYQKAAELGSPAGILYLAKCYLNGTGVEQNFWKAADLVEKLGGEDKGLILELRGLACLHGSGIRKDEKLAARYILSAAQMGNPEAQYVYGYLCIAGIGVKENVRAGIKWVRKAADNGSASALKFMSIAQDEINKKKEHPDEILDDMKENIVDQMK